MSRRAVILSAVPVSTALCRYVQPGDFVVACDAGYRNAERLDLRPDLIVGDFDSAPQPKTEHETILCRAAGLFCSAGTGSISPFSRWRVG